MHNREIPTGEATAQAFCLAEDSSFPPLPLGTLLLHSSEVESL